MEEPPLSLADLGLSDEHPAKDAKKETRSQLVRAKAEDIELAGREQFFILQKSWSSWLLIWISALLMFHVALTVCVGRGWLDFTAYPYFLPMVVGQNFLQIVGMGLVIVKFLYHPSPKSKDENG
jgi:hypothetical protein